jgi:hypothetical protein
VFKIVSNLFGVYLVECVNSVLFCEQRTIKVVRLMAARARNFGF